MENNTIVTNVILDKKMEGYHWEGNNFVAPGEITVTITLDEYRDLVAKNATRKADIDEANKNKFTRDKENEDLKAKVAALTAEIYELQKKLGATNEATQED